MKEGELHFEAGKIHQHRAVGSQNASSLVADIPGAFSPPTGGSPAQPHHRLNRTKYNNYLGFLYLGVAISNNLFAALTRFLLVIVIAFFSL